MRVSVDLDRCEAHGVCMGIAPDVFERDADDGLHVHVPSPPRERWPEMREAAMSCPKQAITISEDCPRAPGLTWSGNAEAQRALATLSRTRSSPRRPLPPRRRRHSADPPEGVVGVRTLAGALNA